MKEHYFSEKQTSPFELKTINATLRGKGYTFNTAPGVFSASKIDFGTKVLAKKMRIGENDTVLDLGCGIGVIGRVAATLTNNKITLTDLNKRACKLAKMNVKGIKNTEVVQGNGFEPIANEKFDVILLNPPQTAGKKLCFEMIENSKKHLNKNGTLQLVARHNKGGKTLSEKMQEVFGNIETVTKQGGYRVYLSKLK
ncbi:MAG: methyltransferase [archaeon]